MAEMTKDELEKALILSIYDRDELYRVMIKKYTTIHAIGMILGKDYMLTINETLNMLLKKLEEECQQ